MLRYHFLTQPTRTQDRYQHHQVAHGDDYLTKNGAKPGLCFNKVALLGGFESVNTVVQYLACWGESWYSVEQMTSCVLATTISVLRIVTSGSKKYPFPSFLSMAADRLARDLQKELHDLN